MTDAVLIALIGGLVSVVNVALTLSVRSQVKTANAQSIAQLSDAAESRRIRAILPHLRTTMENDHIASVDDAGVAVETPMKSMT